jgi:hypothetical protein
MIPPEVVIVPAIFAIPAVVLVVRMTLRHKEKMAELESGSPRRGELEARLDRIEQAVETIAIEMERVGEGQRFVTKLLAERPAPQVADGMASQRERSTTPH